MLRYLDDKLQPTNGRTALAVEVKGSVVRMVRMSTNTGKVIKVLEVFEGQEADRQARWVYGIY